MEISVYLRLSQFSIIILLSCYIIYGIINIKRFTSCPINVTSLGGRDHTFEHKTWHTPFNNQLHPEHFAEQVLQCTFVDFKCHFHQCRAIVSSGRIRRTDVHLVYQNSGWIQSSSSEQEFCRLPGRTSVGVLGNQIHSLPLARKTKEALCEWCVFKHCKCNNALSIQTYCFLWVC